LNFDRYTYFYMINEVLINLGLSEEEVDVYTSLLNSGGQSASQLSKTTKVKRTHIYNIASSLVKRGLVSQNKTNGTTIFVPLSPDKLLSLAHDKKDEAERIESTLEAVLPNLKSKYNLAENKPVISFYEGKEGVKKVYLDTISEAKPILALVETTKVDLEMYKWVTTEYVKMRVKNDIPVKAIVASGLKTKTYIGLDKTELRETKEVPSDKFPFENEINIYGNKVSIINHKKGSKLLGIIIDNPIVANTFRSWFHLTWSRL